MIPQYESREMYLKVGESLVTALMFLYKAELPQGVDIQGDFDLFPEGEGKEAYEAISEILHIIEPKTLLSAAAMIKKWQAKQHKRIFKI